MRKLLALLAALIQWSCDYPTDNVHSVGQLVIDHYAELGDTLKMKAAQFLVENMQYHNSLDNPLLDQYYEGIARINQEYDYPECIAQYELLYDSLGQLNERETKVINDTTAIDAETLINNIDLAFKDWKEGLWASHLSFDEFCEYLLPYRVGSEKFEPWRKVLREEFWGSTDIALKSEDMYDQVYWAACKVNDALRKRRFHNQKVLPQIDAEWPVSVLKNIKMGECYDYARWTTYVMRACGIPIAIDFTPQWPDRAHNHHWNVLFDNTGYSIPFMGGESNPGNPSKEGRKMAKVYRCTFAYQHQSLYALNEQVKAPIPPSLDSPFIKDVSTEYFKGYDLTINLNNACPGDAFAYLAVFDNQEWVPVAFSKIDSRGKATFCNLGADIVYMPVYWRKDGCVPAGDIFILNRDGSIQTLQADEQRLQSITIGRKYPLYNRIVKFRMLMEGGHFEASDTPDFRNAIDCGGIECVSMHGYDTLVISDIGSHRYWRYVSPDRGKCNVAELVFLTDSMEHHPFKILSEGGAMGKTKPEDAFDGNRLTYYESQTEQNGWVGADMGKPIRINKIVFLPRNDDNDIAIGHTYELVYYKDGHEVSAGRQEAKSEWLTFYNVPSGTVYVLHDLTGGREERIFTYDNQIKWY